MSHINSMQYLGRTVLYKKQDDEIMFHCKTSFEICPSISRTEIMGYS
mgnify:CR=1 FL=1